MEHSFEVGGYYRNRQAEYEVLSIAEPNMTVRFADGRTLTAKIDIFKTIWENLQAEAAASRVPDDDRKPGTKAPQVRVTRRTTRFTGLQEADFKGSVTGTSWRAGDQLGGLLAERLSDELGVKFRSWPVYRQARVYLTYDEVDARNREEGTRVVKFYFSLDHDGARCGLLIEKNDGPMDEAWDWPRFIQRLGTGNGLESVVDGMRRLGLEAEVRLTEANKEVAGGSLRAVDGQLTWREPDGQASVVSWRDFAQRLEDVPPGVWEDLYFYASIPKAEGLELKAEIAERAAQVYRALYPLYRMAQR